MFGLWTLSFIPQAYAQCDPKADSVNLGECLTLGVGADKSIGDIYTTPASLINQIVSTLFIVGGIAFFLLMIYAGSKFITGASKGKDEAKTILSTAFRGLIIMFVAYWIVRIIEVLVGTDLLF